MQDDNRDSKPSMSDRLRWLDNTDEIINLSRSIWATRYGSLDDNDRHVREVNQQSDKPNESCQPNQSNESDKDCDGATDCSGDCECGRGYN